MGQVSFNDEELRALVQKAIFDALTPDKRDELLTKAIGALTVPQHNQYDRTNKSELQRIFEKAAGVVASDLMREMLEQPEWKEKIRAVVVEGCNSVLNGGELRDKLVDKVRRAVEQAYGERY